MKFIDLKKIKLDGEDKKKAALGLTAIVVPGGGIFVGGLMLYQMAKEKMSQKKAPKKYSKKEIKEIENKCPVVKQSKDQFKKKSK